MRIECFPARSPLSASSWFPGGEERSPSLPAWFNCTNFRLATFARFPGKPFGASRPIRIVSAHLPLKLLIIVAAWNCAYHGAIRTSSLARNAILNLTKIPIEYPSVDRCERGKLRGRHVLVDLMHGLADEAELEHRAIILDEARVRGAARGGELRPATGRIRHRVDAERGDRG